jgi:four helix bundle protein
MENTASKQAEPGGKFDIHDRIFGFVVRVIKMVNSLPKNESNQVIIPQLLRSVTSIGANDQEADGTLTKKDFIHCYTVVRKETRETLFWLQLIAETNPDFKRKMALLVKENKELVLIISSIINKTRSNNAKECEC